MARLRVRSRSNFKAQLSQFAKSGELEKELEFSKKKEVVAIPVAPLPSTPKRANGGPVSHFVRPITERIRESQEFLIGLA